MPESGKSSLVLAAIGQLLDPENPPVSSEEIDTRVAATAKAVRDAGPAGQQVLSQAMRELLQLRPRMLLLFPVVKGLYEPSILATVLEVLEAAPILKGHPPSPKSWMGSLAPWISGEIGGEAAYGWDDDMHWRTRRAAIRTLLDWGPRLAALDASRVLTSLRAISNEDCTPDTKELLQSALTVIERTVQSSSQTGQKAAPRSEAESALIRVLGDDVAIPLLVRADAINRGEREQVAGVEQRKVDVENDPTLTSEVRLAALESISCDKAKIVEDCAKQRTEHAQKMRELVVAKMGGTNGVLSDRQVAKMHAASELVREQGARKDQLTTVRLTCPTAAKRSFVTCRYA